jgi:Na+/H+ antiporter NhaD/arsenite permease-like protein
MVKIGSTLHRIESRVTKPTNAHVISFFLLLTIVYTVLASMRLPIDQMISLLVFVSTVAGTLLFWNFRLAFAFGGVGLLMASRILSLNLLIDYMSLDVIVFLVSMMIIVETTERTGVFRAAGNYLVKISSSNPRKLLVSLMLLAALLAALIDEVTAILIMGTMIIETCERLKLDFKPFMLSTVFAINIGSAATVLGNPVGILIAFKAGLSFEDFLVWATPVVLICLGVTILIMLTYFRKQLTLPRDLVDPQIQIQSSWSKDYKCLLALSIFLATLILVALHVRLESFLDLEKNTLLLAIPFIAAALALTMHHKDAKEIVEGGVDWWTLLFFMFLFAKAATLQQTGVIDRAAIGIVRIANGNDLVLSSILTWPMLFLSGTIDNVPLIAALIPIVHAIEQNGMVAYPYWWIILFVGCFGGNLTLVGSTANIVALGLMEKKTGGSIGFMEWFKIGLIVCVVTLAIAQLSILLRQPHPI